MKILMKPFSLMEPRYWTMFLCLRCLCRAISSCRGCEYLPTHSRYTCRQINCGCVIACNFHTLKSIHEYCIFIYLYYIYKCTFIQKLHHWEHACHSLPSDSELLLLLPFLVKLIFYFIFRHFVFIKNGTNCIPY